ncbi:MAG TPA: helix-turn-helix domain-containing protein [Solirubrobacteraceae bacterium]|nr:helix-turn-helix domain-containing protein [Solirubrobacteraceae bacterium]
MSSPRHRTQWTPLARALGAAGDHWTLPIALELGHERRRPVQLQERLAVISSGVLDRHLQQMVALGLLTRRRFHEVPPRVELQLTGAGRELLPIAGALARWGMRHMWSAPQAHEHVDVGALLALLPVLLEGAERLPEGTLEVTVEGLEPALVSHRFRIAQGRVRTLEAAARRPATSVTGDTSAWVAALGPERRCESLRFAGHEALARRVLQALPRPGGTPQPSAIPGA